MRPQTVVARLAPSAAVEDALREAAHLAAGGSSETGILIERFPELIDRSPRRLGRSRC